MTSRAAVAFVLFSLLAGPVAADDALARAPSRFVKMDDVRLHYKVLGDGKSTVILIHGWTCDHSFWAAQAGLADGRVSSPERRPPRCSVRTNAGQPRQAKDRERSLPHTIGDQLADALASEDRRLLANEVADLGRVPQGHQPGVVP